ncbi:MAG: orotidine-5'-phosphate decarboxylase [Azospirillaceae bacterium]|nr:orotidine-5'-phosphate decarboxylase [Azospirillaceae bacterium]
MVPQTALPSNPIFVSVDTTEIARARQIVDLVGGSVGGIKLGLEFFTAQGPSGIRRVLDGIDLPLFLDLKLHDIPNTVAGAVRAAAALSPAFLTIHAAGGLDMMRAAAAVPARPRLLAVTVLTSLDEPGLDAIGQRGPIADQVARLADLAQRAGVDGVVCAPQEVARLRAQCGPDFVLMVPGIRPAGSAVGDQKRVMTPRQALDQGATHLVIGRPILDAADPAQAAREIAASLALPHTARPDDTP